MIDIQSSLVGGLFISELNLSTIFPAKVEVTGMKPASTITLD